MLLYPYTPSIPAYERRSRWTLRRLLTWDRLEHVRHYPVWGWMERN